MLQQDVARLHKWRRSALTASDPRLNWMVAPCQRIVRTGCLRAPWKPHHRTRRPTSIRKLPRPEAARFACQPFYPNARALRRQMGSSGVTTRAEALRREELQKRRQFFAAFANFASSRQVVHGNCSQAEPTRIGQSRSAWTDAAKEKKASLAEGPFLWSGREDSNLRPLRPERSALPG